MTNPMMKMSPVMISRWEKEFLVLEPCAEPREVEAVAIGDGA